MFTYLRAVFYSKLSLEVRFSYPGDLSYQTICSKNMRSTYLTFCEMLLAGLVNGSEENVNSS